MSDISEFESYMPAFFRRRHQPRRPTPAKIGNIAVMALWSSGVPISSGVFCDTEASAPVYSSTRRSQRRFRCQKTDSPLSSLRRTL
jgi:hypothetical protein